MYFSTECLERLLAVAFTTASWCDINSIRVMESGMPPFPSSLAIPLPVDFLSSLVMFACRRVTAHKYQS